MHQIAACLLLCSLSSLALANPPLSAEPEVYQGPPSSAPPPALKSGLVGLAPSLTVVLTPPSASELAALAVDADPLIVGFGRDIPAADQLIQGAQLAWASGAGGGQTAVFSVSSPGARALRLQLDLGDLPPAVELRFFAPFGPAQVSGPIITGEAGIGDGYWSPTVAGDTLAVEVYLPAGLAPADVSISLPRVSHLVADPGQPADLRKNLQDVGSSQACEIDVRCRPEVPDSVVNSVAKYIATDLAGQSGLCSGTLLADSDPNTQIPYFLTNHHCGVSNPQVAASIELYWFFERATCGGPNPTSVTSQSGGATVLSAASQYVGNDHALLQLNQQPPAGVSFSGWSATPAAINAGVVGVHHPNGDIKKVSFGTVLNYASVSPDPANAEQFLTITDGVGPYLELGWQEGITEGGSSGSGVWLRDTLSSGGGPYLVASQLGGGSSCQTPQTSDSYGRFDLTYKAGRFWLAGSADYSTIWLEPAKSGQGVQLLQNGSAIQGAWYTYDANGQPMWLTFVAQINNGTASASLLRFSGPALGSPWTNPNFVEAGQVNLSFTSPTSVSFQYSLDGVTDSLTLQPFSSISAAGYTGVWYDQSTSGQGVQLIQGGRQLSGAWYLYDGNGNPLWLTFVGNIADNNTLTTTLLRFSGPALGAPWDNNQVQFVNGGQVTLSLTSATTIRMDYQINGVTGTLNLIPFPP